VSTKAKGSINMKNYVNETVASILERRSIRKYKPEQISKEELDCIVECGLNAPSAMNSQNWHFTVIQNKDLIKKMSDKIRVNLPPAMVERYKKRQNGREDFSLFYDAPTIILISVDADDSYSDFNGAYATENMCLAAHSVGVASVIIGLTKILFSTDEAESFKKELCVPEGYKPLYAVCFGYADMHPDKPERIDGKLDYIR